MEHQNSFSRDGISQSSFSSCCSRSSTTAPILTLVQKKKKKEEAAYGSRSRECFSASYSRADKETNVKAQQKPFFFLYLYAAEMYVDTESYQRSMCTDGETHRLRRPGERDRQRRAEERLQERERKNLPHSKEED